MGAVDQNSAARPILLFDGDCGVCRKAVLRLDASVGGRVSCVPFQEYDFADAPAGLTAEACAEAVHLVEADGMVTRAAEACFRAAAVAPGKGWLRAAYHLPGITALAEWGYRKVAAHRSGISRLQRLLSGADPEPSAYGFGRRAFVLLLGLAFVASFLSFGVQAPGLIGSDGALPLARMLVWDAHSLPGALLEMPTLFWFAQGDAALYGVIAAGTLAALGLTVGLWPRVTLPVAWVAWLSLTALAVPPTGSGYVGNVFLGYQWDGLLVEAGLLGFFVLPAGVRPCWRDRSSAAGLFLLRLLLLRVVFGEALVKIVSGDPTWAESGSLGQHLWTQPMPTWIGLYVQEWGGATLDLFAWFGAIVGLGLVFGLFGPRRLRLLAVLGIAVAEIGGFLVFPRGVWPLLVLALACTAVDDVTWRRLLPGRLSRRVLVVDRRFAPAWAQWIRGVAALCLALLALYVGSRFLAGAEPSTLQLALQRTQVVNGYGPSPSVAIKRLAVTIEGSDDGETWTAFEPRSAPRDPYRAPVWPGLHLRRLDWKLDDVAQRVVLGEPPPTWFVLMLERLLEGSPDVRALFVSGSYESAPPRAVRVEVHELLPASAEDRGRDAMWWYRRPGASVGTPAMLEDGELVPARF